MFTENTAAVHTILTYACFYEGGAIKQTLELHLLVSSHRFNIPRWFVAVTNVRGL